MLNKTHFGRCVKAGEMTQQLGTFAALAEGSGLVASTNVQLSTSCSSRSRLHHPFWPLQHQAHM